MTQWLGDVASLVKRSLHLSAALMSEALIHSAGCQTSFLLFPLIHSHSQGFVFLDGVSLYNLQFLANCTFKM